MESNKGNKCFFKGVLCQEGFCENCIIKEQVLAGQVIDEIAEKESRREEK